jgi:hypothetical protein
LPCAVGKPGRRNGAKLRQEKGGPFRPAGRPVRSGGPHPGVLAIVSLGIFLTSLILSAILTGGQTFVSPFAPEGQVAAFFQRNVPATRLAGMLQFGSAVPLGIYEPRSTPGSLGLACGFPGRRSGFSAASAQRP